MIEWLDANVAYWHWIVLGLIIGGAEIFVPSFFLLWIGAAAVVVGLVLLVATPGITLQFVLWGGFSLLFLLLWHKIISPRMQDKTMAGLSKEAISGQVGTVLSYSVVSNRGVMRFPAPLLGNDEWAFISTDEVKPGDRVEVYDVAGNALLVRSR